MRRNRMDYDDYNYGYDHDRPLLQGKTYRKELAKASETFKQELNVNGINFSRSLDAGRAYAESMHQQAGGDPLCDDALVNHGPFTLFLVLWFKAFLRYCQNQMGMISIPTAILHCGDFSVYLHVDMVIVAKVRCVSWMSGH